MANNNQLANHKVLVYIISNTQSDKKMTHPESISKMLHILGILTDHIATSKLATIKSQVTSVNVIRKDIKKNEAYLEIVSECATFYIPYTLSLYFLFS